MIKRILVPLDPSPYTQTALNFACFIAKKNASELTGIVVLDKPGIISSSGPVSVGGAYYAKKAKEHREEEANERIQSLLTMFRLKCEEEGVAHQESECQGCPADQIIKASCYFDAIMIGMRTYFHFQTSDKHGDTLTKILDRSITPIYAVPREVPIPTKPEHVTRALIAFDGSLHAARALHRFAQLSLSNNFDVILIDSNKNKNKAELQLRQANAYLKSHGFANVKKVWTTKNIISIIDEEYIEWANLIVVGAHSKKGILDFILGSLPRHLIKLNRKPVLIG